MKDVYGQVDKSWKNREIAMHFAKETKVAHALASAFSGQKWSSRVFQVISTFWDRVKWCQDLSTAIQLSLVGAFVRADATSVRKRRGDQDAKIFLGR